MDIYKKMYYKLFNAITDSLQVEDKKVADELITEDGTSGEWVQVLETGGYPILLAHWQSLVSKSLWKLNGFA